MNELSAEINQEVYNNRLKRIDDRPKNIDELTSLALACALSENLDIESRISAAVVFIYKELEQNRIPGIDINYFLNSSLNLRRGGGIRSDAIQLRLSILTAAWHIAVAQRDPELLKTYLEEIYSILRLLLANRKGGASSNRPAYSKNIGCGMSLLSFILYRLGDTKRATSASNHLVRYHKMNMTGVKPGMDPSVFNDTLKCGRSAYLSLCVVYACKGKMKMSVERRLKGKDFAANSTRITERRYLREFSEFLESIGQ